MVRGHADALHDALDGVTMAAVHAVCGNNLGLLRRFTPDVFDGDPLVVTAAGSTDPARARAAWAPYATGTVRTEAVDTDHFGMLRPGPAARIGALVTAHLDRRDR